MHISKRAHTAIPEAAARGNACRRLIIGTHPLPTGRVSDRDGAVGACLPTRPRDWVARALHVTQTWLAPRPLYSRAHAPLERTALGGGIDAVVRVEQYEIRAPLTREACRLWSSLALETA